MSDPLNGERFRCDQGDVLPWLASLPEQSCDLVFGSPPYVGARLYLENGQDLGIARDAETWAKWMFQIVKASLRVCKGLVAFVVEGSTSDYRYDAAPVLLMADLHRAGIHLRKPPIYRRVGIPGSGGSRQQHADEGGGADWLRNDYEFVLCCTGGGKLPWADGTACGHPPKWAPGGEMSHRLTSGQRVNQWGNKVSADGFLKDTERQADGTLKTRSRKPSHKVQTVGEDQDAPLLFEGGEVLPPPASVSEFGMTGEVNSHAKKVTKKHTKRRAGKEAARVKSCHQSDGTTEDQTYIPPVLANPGNVINQLYTAEKVATLLGQPADIIDCKVGGGQMGSDLAHENEAPFPESLAEFFVCSFCPPGGIVLDPFSGSGTTAAVAMRWGRRALCCDLRQSQVELTRRRVADETTLFDGLEG